MIGITATTSEGTKVVDPTAEQLSALVDTLGPSSVWLVVDRTEDALTYVQVASHLGAPITSESQPGEAQHPVPWDGTFHVEHQEGSTRRRWIATTDDRDLVQEVMLSWAQDHPEWRELLNWKPAEI